jgi:Uma2 family endonuclease
MVMGAKTAPTWQEFLAAGKLDQRWEYMGGEMRFMSPTGSRHGRVIHKISYKLGWWETLAPEWVCFGTDVVFTMKFGEWLCPDAAIVRRERYGPVGIPAGPTPFAPDVAIEVISPNDRSDDIEMKRSLYQKNHILQVWIDPEAGTLELTTPQGSAELFHRGQNAVILPGLGLDVSTLID